MLSAVVAALLIDISVVIIVAIIAFVIGALVAFLAVTPAKIAADRNSRAARHAERETQHELEDMRHRYAQLEAEHRGLLAERDHLRSQLNGAPASAASGLPAGSAPPTSAGELRSWRGDEADNRADGNPQHAEQSSIADRLRGMFGPHDDSDRREQDRWGRDHPPAPTA
jgi:hypothetical protein